MRKPDFATVMTIGLSTGGTDRRYGRQSAHQLCHLIVLVVLGEVNCCFGECERCRYHRRCVDTIITAKCYSDTIIAACNVHPIEFDIGLLCCACVRVKERGWWLGGFVELGGFLGFG
ncbi:Hypothetical predicted protein [Olea europaea subsp. europaea]|uniref:Uncharacterized protein n=1 Tax=Olea europaea subsp. europaea TaxID=158383 RepID=A0A8S0S5V2_OLEEU|nr:Hypothetical predicted protein [Olea europaea subsp. europaea]